MKALMLAWISLEGQQGWVVAENKWNSLITRAFSSRGQPFLCVFTVSWTAPTRFSPRGFMLFLHHIFSQVASTNSCSNRPFKWLKHKSHSFVWSSYCCLRGGKSRPQATIKIFFAFHYELLLLLIISSQYQLNKKTNHRPQGREKRNL